MSGAGTAGIFMFTEPLAGWREATARPTKTKLDWATEMARLMESRYRKCPMVTVVCDNLNTHTIGGFYEAFTPPRARALVRRIHFCHTPKHGSWLNIAENELSSLTRQCVSERRFSALPKLQSERSAWSTDVNGFHVQVRPLCFPVLADLAEDCRDEPEQLCVVGEQRGDTGTAFNLLHCVVRVGCCFAACVVERLERRR